MSDRLTYAFKKSTGEAQDEDVSEDEKKTLEDEAVHGKRRLPQEGDACPVSTTSSCSSNCLDSCLTIRFVISRCAMRTLRPVKPKAWCFAPILAVVLCISSVFSNGLLLLAEEPLVFIVVHLGRRQPAPPPVRFPASLTK